MKKVYKRIKFLILDKIDNFLSKIRVKIGSILWNMYHEDEEELIYSDFFDCYFKEGDFK